MFLALASNDTPPFSEEMRDSLAYAIAVHKTHERPPIDCKDVAFLRQASPSDVLQVSYSQGGDGSEEDLNAYMLLNMKSGYQAVSATIVYYDKDGKKIDSEEVGSAERRWNLVKPLAPDPKGTGMKKTHRIEIENPVVEKVEIDEDVQAPANGG